MSQDKYPNLSNADLAELLGLNRLIQFEQLPQRFKDMNTYIPYGHDLIELIRERLLSGEEELPVERSKDAYCEIDLTYYFTRNADLREMLNSTMNRYGILLSRPQEEVITDMLQAIHDNSLIAKTVPGGPEYFVLISWDIHDRGPFGDIIARSKMDDWIITQKIPERVKIIPLSDLQE